MTKTVKESKGCSLVTEHLPSLCKVLGSIPRTEKKRTGEGDKRKLCWMRKGEKMDKGGESGEREGKKEKEGLNGRTPF